MPPTPRSPGFRRCFRTLTVVAGALVLSSCFEAPIRESLELRFLADGTVRVQSTSEIASTANLSDNPGLLRRVTEAQLPGTPLEVEGFAAKGNELTAPGPGLWQALSALQGRWVSPDPILLHLDAEGRERKEPVQLSEILRQPRRAEAPPSALEVRQEIERRLQPARVYRATWRVEPSPL